MSHKTSHRVSKSSPQSRSESPNPLIEPLPSELEADIARVINENLKNVHNTPNKKWQVLDSSISGPPQSSNRIITLIPNFHGIVGPSHQTSGPPPPPNPGNHDWQRMDTSCGSSDITPPSPGWFGAPISRDQNLQVDGRLPPPFWGPPSPPRGHLPYPAPYHHQRPPIPISSVHPNSNEIQRLSQEGFGGDGRPLATPSYHGSPDAFQPPFSSVQENIKHYPMPPVPDAGTYYLAPPPEPFMEYAFAFESGLHTNHGLMRYPMLPPPGQQVERNQYHPHHLIPYPPLPSNAIPVIEQQMDQLEISAQIHRTHPSQYASPPAPHLVFSPPIPPARAVLFPEPLNQSVNYHFQENTIAVDRSPNVLRSFLRNVSPAKPIKAKRRGQSLANTGNAALSTQANQRQRRTSLPVVRSPLLEQFRSDRDKSSKTWTIKDIIGHIVEFSTDQHGSRFIQSNLEAISDEEKQKIFEEIFPDNTEKLILDVFGNYVVQKFFDLGTKAQKDAFTEVLEQRAIEFSLHIYGCRVIQKAIDSISADRQTVIIQRLEQDILVCIKDPNGNHVIQKLVQTVPGDRLTFLSVLCDNIVALGTHSYGCRVLQRCLEHIPMEYQQQILNAIHKHTLDLIHDQYGNYVIQFIIEHGKDLDRITSISSILGKLVELSRHKYASNVCEKALIFSDSAIRRKLIDEIMIWPSSEGAENQIISMIQDQYANYVLQRALVLAEGTQKEALYAQVIPALTTLRTGIMATHPSRPLLSIERLVRVYSGNPVPTQLGSEAGGPVFENNVNLMGCPIPPF